MADGDGNRVELVGFAFGRGARDPGCADGPRALRDGDLVGRLARRGVRARWHAFLEETPGLERLDAVVDVNTRLADVIEHLVARNARFVVLGGDHSCGIGTWSGAARSVRPRGPLGLVWIDAHMDSHTPETTPSGAHHGMPVAALLGHGDPRLTGLSPPGPAILPNHVCLVGARSFEPQEPVLLQRLGVCCYLAHEVAAEGIAPVLARALATAARDTPAFGLSLDLDVLDPGHAPGVGSPVDGGLAPAELVAAIRGLVTRPECLGLEIVEYNPHHDREERTQRIVADLIASAVAPSA